eukprot:736618_1
MRGTKTNKNPIKKVETNVRIISNVLWVSKKRKGERESDTKRQKKTRKKNQKNQKPPSSTSFVITLRSPGCMYCPYNGRTIQTKKLSLLTASDRDKRAYSTVCLFIVNPEYCLTEHIVNVATILFGALKTDARPTPAKYSFIVPVNIEYTGKFQQKLKVINDQDVVDHVNALMVEHRHDALIRKYVDAMNDTNGSSGGSDDEQTDSDADDSDSSCVDMEHPCNKGHSFAGIANDTKMLCGKCGEVRVIE